MLGEDLNGRHKSEIDTPVLLLYIDVVEGNISKMENIFSDKGCKLRPHIKTHKLPMIAHKRIPAGAIGITCAKLGEEKIFLESGVKDILIANEIVEDIRIQTLVNLLGYGDLIVCVDHFENARDIPEAAERMVWT